MFRCLAQSKNAETSSKTPNNQSLSKEMYTKNIHSIFFSRSVQQKSIFLSTLYLTRNFFIIRFLLKIKVYRLYLHFRHSKNFVNLSKSLKTEVPPFNNHDHVILRIPKDRIINLILEIWTKRAKSWVIFGWCRC